jgi:fatty acid amide hydrolase
LGIGTDIGGSVRIPAAFSGIASIKPTAGRTPDLGRFSVPVGQHAVPSQVGVMARRVEDVALGLAVINGGRDPLGEPSMPLGDFRQVDVSKLRVAYYTDDGTFAPAPAVVRAVRETAEMMRSLGAQVTAWKPPLADQALDLVYGVFVADGGKLMNALLGKGTRAPQVKELIMGAGLPHWAIQLMMTLLNSMGQHGKAAGMRAFGHSDTAHFWKLAEAVLDYQERFQDALDHDAGGPFDVILSPACPLPAYTHGSSSTLLTAGAYALIYNALGFPAGVVPVTRVRADEQVGRKPSKDMVEKAALAVEEKSVGLPIGVQVAARPWREHIALATMHAIEQMARGLADFPVTPVGM